MEDKNEQIYSQYDLEINSTYRFKGDTYLDCNNGLKVIRAYDYSEKKAELENDIKLELAQKNFVNTDIFYRNKAGTYISLNKYSNKYVLKKWYKGEECNMNDIEDVKRAAAILAKLHLLLSKLGDDSCIHERIAKKNTLKEYTNFNLETRRVKKYILNKKKKNSLEIDFLDSIDYFYNQGNDAICMLEEAGFTDMYIRAVSNHILCHGNYNHHNLIMGDEVAVTNFGRSFCGVQIYDIYSFIRKVMEKNDWNTTYADSIINEYCRTKNITDGDYAILCALLSYPEKYHKIVNSYYNSQKVWVSGRIKQKLSEVTRQEQLRTSFLTQMSVKCKKTQTQHACQV